uniref:Unkown protein n=1 Tax=Riptortus pedestris TaxID=329032 RepID=R4WE65_RIPPE|nr:unkown protein [Riptortus pedestris]
MFTSTGQSPDTHSSPSVSPFESGSDLISLSSGSDFKCFSNISAAPSSKTPFTRGSLLITTLFGEIISPLGVGSGLSRVLGKWLCLVRWRFRCMACVVA